MKEIMDILYRIKKRAVEIIGWSIIPLCHFDLNERKIVVSSYYSRGYSDNPKAIVDELLLQDRDYIFIFISEGHELISARANCRFVKPGTLASIYHLATAKVWIDNCRKSFYTRKRDGQLYMQTWHGCALKRIEADAVGSLSRRYINSAMNDARMCDLIISDSAYMTNIYKNSFWYDGEIITCGLPRADILINNSFVNQDAIRKSLNIPEKKRVITYAPTFRGNLSLNPYDIDYSRLQSALAEKFGGDWIVMLRLHPNIARKSQEIIEQHPGVIDASSHHDPQDILLISDALITDYSSIMFDFMLTGRPAFLYANDIEEYTADRNFYFDLKEIPYSLATSNDELFENVGSYDEDKQVEDTGAFLTKIGAVMNGTASAIAANRIKKWIEEG